LRWSQGFLLNFYPLPAMKKCGIHRLILATFIAAKLTGALLARFWIAEIYLRPSDRKN
jgi:hypothetical protein